MGAITHAYTCHTNKHKATENHSHKERKSSSSTIESCVHDVELWGSVFSKQSLRTVRFAVLAFSNNILSLVSPCKFKCFFLRCLFILHRICINLSVFKVCVREWLCSEENTCISVLSDKKAATHKTKQSNSLAIACTFFWVTFLWIDSN